MRKTITLLLLLLVCASSIATALDSHVVMIRGVGAEQSFNSIGSWDRAVTIKESEHAKYFEFAIWEELSAIHFYEFPKEYDVVWAINNLSLEDQVAYRESFLIFKSSLPLSHTGELESELWPQRVSLSKLTKNLILKFIEEIASRFPDSEYAFIYQGHGAPGGDLLMNPSDGSGLISPQDTYEMLRAWTDIIGKNLLFIDFGGPCSKGGFSDLATICPYTNYFIASDHPNGGYEADFFDQEKQEASDPDSQWHNIFSESESTIEALEKRIYLHRLRYLDARNNLTEKTHMQANYLYSCSAFNEFAPLYVEAAKSTGRSLYESMSEFSTPYNDRPPYLYDLRESVLALGDPTLTSMYDQIIVAEATNRDFFNWEAGYSGIITPNSLSSYGDDNLDFEKKLPITAKELPKLETGDIDGEPIEVSIYGGVSIDDRKTYTNTLKSGDVVNITTIIEPDDTHLSEDIEIIVAVIDTQKNTIILLTPDGLTQYDDGGGIPYFLSKKAAPRMVVQILDDIQIGDVEPTEYDLRVGYRLKGKQNIYFNLEPILFLVE